MDFIIVMLPILLVVLLPVLMMFQKSSGEESLGVVEWVLSLFEDD